MNIFDLFDIWKIDLIFLLKGKLNSEKDTQIEKLVTDQLGYGKMKLYQIKRSNDQPNDFNVLILMYNNISPVGLFMQFFA